MIEEFENVVNKFVKSKYKISIELYDLKNEFEMIEI